MEYLVPSRPRFLSLARRDMKRSMRAPPVAINAAEDFDEQQRDLVVLAAEGIVVVTCVKLYEALARGVVVRAVGGHAALAAAQHGAAQGLLRVAKGVDVAHVLAAGARAALGQWRGHF